MSECVDLPAYARSYSEFLEQKLMAEHHVVDHLRVERARLVVHGPAAIDEFYLTLCNQFANLVFCICILIAPPHAKVLDFDDGEGALITKSEVIFLKLFDYAIKLVPDA